MIAVVLDASCLRKEGLASPAMLELTRLAENRRVVVVLPEMAVREHLSQHEDELAAQLDAAGRSLKSVARGMRIPDPPVEAIDRLTAAIAALEPPLREAYVAGFNAWAHRCKARRIKFDGGRVEDVIDDYFTGAGVFSSRKSRKDFPDALILSSASAISAEFEHFHLVASDENLRLAADRLGMQCHENLQTFLEASVIRRARDTLAAEQETRGILEALLSIETLDRISAWLRKGSDELALITLEQEEIDGLERVGASAHGATIEGPIPEAIRFIGISLASPSGNDAWALSIRFETQCKLGFVTSWLDSMKLERERDVTVVSADEWVELSESWWARFDAELIVDTTQWQPGTDTGVSIIEIKSPQLLVNRAVLLKPVSYGALTD